MPATARPMINFTGPLFSVTYVLDDGPLPRADRRVWTIEDPRDWAEAEAEGLARLSPSMTDVRVEPFTEAHRASLLND
jgi:hypothetical protein